MLRLLIGLRILRGPRPTKSLGPHLGSTRRRVLLGICCLLIASAATHSGAGRAAGPSPITAARESIAGHIHDPSALFVTAKTRRILEHVDRVDLSYSVYGVYGTAFFATVFYKLFPGDLTGQVIINRLPDANPLAVEKDCRAHGHKVTRVKIGRYRTYYCADDTTFGYLWRWDHRIYTVDSNRYGGIGPAGLRALISHMTYAR
jgi:hypothetical protein